MNVLSLFDGISCGYLALQRANLPITKYFASEIDKNAIKISKNHFPDIIRLGDVCEWQTWELPKIDLLMGGSPCQGFSFAGKQLNFDDPRSKLFFKFVDCLKHFKPKYFFLENVVMNRQSENIITDILGVLPIKINSAVLSAQSRKRLYWTNISNISFQICNLDTIKDIKVVLPYDSREFHIEPSMMKAIEEKNVKFYLTQIKAIHAQLNKDVGIIAALYMIMKNCVIYHF